MKYCDLPLVRFILESFAKADVSVPEMCDLFGWKWAK